MLTVKVVLVVLLVVVIVSEILGLYVSENITKTAIIHSFLMKPKFSSWSIRSLTVLTAPSLFFGICCTTIYLNADTYQLSQNHNVDSLTLVQASILGVSFVVKTTLKTAFTFLFVSLVLGGLSQIFWKSGFFVSTLNHLNQMAVIFFIVAALVLLQQNSSMTFDGEIRQEFSSDLDFGRLVYLNLAISMILTIAISLVVSLIRTNPK